MRKKLMGVVVMNNILAISRAALCILVCIVLLGMLWSAGTMSPIEYSILIIISISSMYGIYISGSKKRIKRSFKKLAFCVGLSGLIIGVITKSLGITESPGVIFLLMTMLPFMCVYILEPKF